MEQNILEQYTELIKELQEIKKDTAKLEKRKRYLEKGNAKEFVKGGYGGIQRFKVDAYAKADIEETEYLINKNIRILKEREKKVHETAVHIEEFINTIEDSRIRRIITFKYIKGMTWNQTAKAMGGSHTADSCRMDLKRFLKK